jgi:hypothetical protein
MKAPVSTRRQITAIAAWLVKHGCPVERAGRDAVACLEWAGYVVPTLPPPRRTTPEPLRSPR